VPGLADSPVRSPSRWVLWTIIPALVFSAGWIMLRVYTSPEARECHALYDAARTNADSTRVDSTVPNPSRIADTNARSCGNMRTSARWR